MSPHTIRIPSYRYIPPGKGRTSNSLQGFTLVKAGSYSKESEGDSRVLGLYIQKMHPEQLMDSYDDDYGYSGDDCGCTCGCCYGDNDYYSGDYYNGDYYG